MNHKGQKSQSKSVLGRIDAVAFVDASPLFRSVRFWDGDKSFVVRFPNHELARRVEQIESALADGSFLFNPYGNGGSYVISEKVLKAVKGILSFVPPPSEENLTRGLCPVAPSAPAVKRHLTRPSEEFSCTAVNANEEPSPQACAVTVSAQAVSFPSGSCQVAHGRTKIKINKS